MIQTSKEQLRARLFFILVNDLGYRARPPESAPPHHKLAWNSCVEELDGRQVKRAMEEIVGAKPPDANFER